MIGFSDREVEETVRHEVFHEVFDMADATNTKEKILAQVNIFLNSISIMIMRHVLASKIMKPSTSLWYEIHRIKHSVDIDELIG